MNICMQTATVVVVFVLRPEYGRTLPRRKAGGSLTEQRSWYMSFVDGGVNPQKEFALP